MQFLTFCCFCAPAVVGPDVRCSSRGGECRTGAEPQSGDRSEAAELHLPTHLAAWNQPHELPTHGTHIHTLQTHSAYSVARQFYCC